MFPRSSKINQQSTRFDEEEKQKDEYLRPLYEFRSRANESDVCVHGPITNFRQLIRSSENNQPSLSIARFDEENKRNDGFDIEGIRGSGLMPFSCQGLSTFTYPYRPLVKRYAKLGLHRYNIKEGTNFELDALIKFNMRSVGACSFLITLAARDTDTVAGRPMQIFQVRVDENRYGRLDATCTTARIKGETTDGFCLPQQVYGFPGWPSDDGVFDASERFCSVEISKLRSNSWIRLYLELTVYHLPSVARKRQRLAKILGAFLSVAELISESAEAMTVVSRDLKEFLTSDSDEIPNSFKQIAKIANSKEFTDSLSRVSQAVTIGVSRGYKSESCSNVVDSEPSVVDRVVDKAFSKAGTGFFSVVVGSFAKNLVLGFRSNEGVTRGDDDTVTPRWLSLLCDERSREVLAECIERFTSTAVGVYLDKTMDINAFDQIFEGMTNPKHQDSVKDVLVSVCNGAIETVVRTSHEVFTTSKSSAVVEEESNGGWTDAISNTLAVPSNRKFMFDVTGRVTLETTKSIIGFLMLKTLQGFRRSFDVVQGEVTERGRQVVGYVGAKASVIVTVWLALYLHIINRCVRNSPIGVSQHF